MTDRGKSPSALEVRGVSHAFDREVVLRDVTLSVQCGSIVCILGPSGSGKTTLLKIIAGLIQPDHGTVNIDGSEQTLVPAWQRDIGFVFQTAGALFPHLKVEDNVSFSLRHCPHRRSRLGSDNWRSAVKRALAATKLTTLARRSVGQLSGGQIQRVALARAVVYKPLIVLLDEPLSAVDNPLKEEIIKDLLSLHDEYNSTFVYVTHDEQEALRIGTHLAVLGEDHRLHQFDRSADVLAKPSHPEVARLLGCWNVLRIQGCDQTGDGCFSAPAILPVPCEDTSGDHTRWIGVMFSRTLLSKDSTSDREMLTLAIQVDRVSPAPFGWRYECSYAKGATLVAYGNTALPVQGDAFVLIQRRDIHVFDDIK